MNEYSFKKGYMQVKKRDLHNVRDEIMETLGIGTMQTFYYRLNGKIIPRVSEAKAIEEIFAKYGITDIWGEE